MKNKFDASIIVKYLILLVLAAIVLVPLSVLVLSAFKTRIELTRYPLFSLPHSFMLDNFIEVYKKAEIPLALKNTAIITCTSVALNVILGAMVSYILARFEFRSKKIVLSSFMVAMIIPFTTIEVARFSIINSLGLFNTYWAPILIYVGADLIQIFVYKQFIDNIPVSLDESAMMDGASYITIFTRIIFPLVVPASLTIAIIKFVDISNDMYTPYLYIPSDSLRTLTTALMIFQGERTLDWGKLSSGVILIMAPPLILYFIFQKRIFAGLVTGASKE